LRRKSYYGAHSQNVYDCRGILIRLVHRLMMLVDAPDEDEQESHDEQNPQEGTKTSSHDERDSNGSAMRQRVASGE
jgi:hypothetical protein